MLPRVSQANVQILQSWLRESVSSAIFIASPDCALSAEQKKVYLQQKIDLIPAHNGEVVGLRLDVCLENPETGESKWVDTTVVHTSCVSYRAAELKHISERKLNATMIDLNLLPDILEHNPSPTLEAREAEKKEKYGRLVLIAAKQLQDGKRTSLPVRSFCRVGFRRTWTARYRTPGMDC